MEASLRIFKSSNRHLSNSIPLKFHPPKSPLRQPPFLVSSPRYFHIHHHTIRTKPFYCNYTCNHSSFPNNSSQTNALGFLQSLSALSTSNPFSSPDPFARITTSPSETKPFRWDLTGGNGEVKGIKDNAKEPIVTAVLLGWLGSKQKHLRRYAELYNSRGINTLSFVAPVTDMLSLDFGRRFHQRISCLADELVSWLSETEKDGRERFLFFHTFSNTGWLAYGTILDDLQGRPDLLERIKGCVVDSGGDPDINPKVWAAGFAAALLKKRSSAAYPSVDTGVQNELESGITVSNMEKKEPELIELVLLSLLEKLFSFLLNTPDLNQRLTKIVSCLSKNQPPCPQLYLYSSADKVIPHQSVESFIKDQKRTGRKVWSYNFESSPHVDHYRTFPATYSLQIQDFLNDCLDMVKQM